MKTKDLYKSIRKPMPPPSRAHDAGKYSRKVKHKKPL